MRDYLAKSISIFLLDDHDIVRRGLRELLAVKRDITVVGDSGSARDAIPRAIELEPDVLVVDLVLQESTGIEVCREVRAAAPSVQALLLTSAGDDEALLAAVLAGAAGYATKLSGTTEILDAIRRIGSGQSLLEPAALLGAKARLGADLASTADNLGDPRILDLTLEGRTNSEIAAELGLGASAVTAAVSRMAQLVTGSLPRRPS